MLENSTFHTQVPSLFYTNGIKTTTDHASSCRGRPPLSRLQNDSSVSNTQFHIQHVTSEIGPFFLSAMSLFALGQTMLQNVSVAVVSSSLRVTTPLSVDGSTSTDALSTFKLRALIAVGDNVGCASSSSSFNNTTTQDDMFKRFGINDGQLLGENARIAVLDIDSSAFPTPSKNCPFGGSQEHAKWTSFACKTDVSHRVVAGWTHPR